MPSGSAIKMLNPTKLTIAEIESQPLLCYTELLALHIDHILWVEWLNITLFALYVLIGESEAGSMVWKITLDLASSSNASLRNLTCFIMVQIRR